MKEEKEEEQEEEDFLVTEEEEKSITKEEEGGAILASHGEFWLYVITIEIIKTLSQCMGLWTFLTYTFLK